MRRFLFILAVFCTTVFWMVLQKPLFLLFYHAQAAQSSFGEWLGVLWHGLTLDSTVAGYVTAFPVLTVLFSLWIPLSRRVWRIILIVYFALISLFAATVSPGAIRSISRPLNSVLRRFIASASSTILF